MKKSLTIIALFILILFPIISALDAQSIDQSPELQQAQNAQQKLNDFSNQDKGDYLKQEWGKILENSTTFGPVINFFDKISPVTNPLSKFLLGIEPSLTWLFTLTLVIWISLIVFTFRILDMTSIFSRWFRYILSFGLIIILSTIGLTKAIAEGIINAISLLNIWWVQLIVIVLLVAGLIVSMILSKYLDKIFLLAKKRSQEEIDREKLHTSAEIAEEFGKALSED